MDDSGIQIFLYPVVISHTSVQPFYNQVGSIMISLIGPGVLTPFKPKANLVSLIGTVPKEGGPSLIDAHPT